MDASTLAPLRKIFTSKHAPYVFGSFTLAILLAKPNILSVLHTLPIGVIYWKTNGALTVTGLYCVYYTAYSPDYTGIRGILIAAYAYGSRALVLRWCQQIPDLASRTINAEKVLLGFTVCLIYLVLPLLLFWSYTLVQIYSYLVCALTVMSLQNKLRESQQQDGQQYVGGSLLFSFLLLTPYICQLEQLSLLHLAYNCLLALYFLSRLPETWIGEQQQQQFPDLGMVSKFIYYMAPSVLLLGFSPWIAMFNVAAVLCAIFFQQQQVLSTRIRKRAPLLLGVGIAMVALLLPWKLFGLMPYLTCLTLVCLSRWITDKLVERMNSLSSSRQLLVNALYQFASLGILLPAMLF